MTPVRAVASSRSQARRPVPRPVSATARAPRAPPPPRSAPVGRPPSPATSSQSRPSAAARARPRSGAAAWPRNDTQRSNTPRRARARGATSMSKQIKTIALCLGAALASLALFALPASAAQQIEEFTTTASTSLAGGHPDLTTSFKLKDAGAPEVARNITFNTPAGIFGNPSVLTQCRAVDFSLNSCAPASQAGLITIRANYEGDPDHLLGTAPIYSLEAGPEETARFAFVAPQLDIPIAIPVTTRSASDYGLRFTVSGITQLAPLSAADITFWGFPAAGAHDAQRFPKGSPGSPAGCPGLAEASGIGEPVVAGMPVAPLTGNPGVYNGQALVSTLDVQTYQD